MRSKVIEISWHDTQPVYSCDFQPIPLAQLKRILPFPPPPPHPAPLHSYSHPHPHPSTPSFSHATPVSTSSRPPASPRPSSSKPVSYSSIPTPVQNGETSMSVPGPNAGTNANAHVAAGSIVSPTPPAAVTPSRLPPPPPSASAAASTSTSTSASASALPPLVQQASPIPPPFSLPVVGDLGQSVPRPTTNGVTGLPISGLGLGLGLVASGSGITTSAPATTAAPSTTHIAQSSTDAGPSTSTSASTITTTSASESTNAGPSVSASTSTSASTNTSDRNQIQGTRAYRLATGGADKTVRIWMIYPNVQTTAQQALPGSEAIKPHPARSVYLATLKRHTAPVNVVRWSPNGQILASAGDDGVIILWTPSDLPTTNFGEDPADEMGDKEYWRDKRVINVTKQSIYDLAWSPDGKYIIAGSTDNLAQIFSVADGLCVHQIQDHSHYVQGVAWDPLDEYIATQSSDRSVQVHAITQRGNTLTVHPASRHGRSNSHSSMEIKTSRAASFNMGTPSIARRSSNASEAGSAITLASEIHDPVVGPSQTPSTPLPLPATPMSAMDPPQARKPSSRRSSFSKESLAGSPLLAPVRDHRGTRSPSPAPLPAIRPTPLTSQSIHQKLYGDELATTFFRRLTFSPDGGLLLTPAGQIEEPHWPPAPPSSSEDESTASAASIPKPKTANADSKSTVYIYTRANLHRPPIAHLPGYKTTTLAVRFSPIFYELRQMSTEAATLPPKQIILDKTNPNPVQVSLEVPSASSSSSSASASADGKTKQAPTSVFSLPYRLMFAVASQDAVLLYDTQQAGPIAIIKGLHYSAFTDIAWSPTGDSLFLSSSDGYCSIVVFDGVELGALHPIQQHQRQLQAIAQSHASAHGNHNLSLPPSPAPSHAKPAIPTLTSRSERESSTSSMASIATSAAPFKGDGVHSSTVSENTGRPPSATPSTSTAAGEYFLAPEKRSSEPAPSDRPPKKRKVELTSEPAAP